MRTVLAALEILRFMGSCLPGMTGPKGIICDATMNTVAIVTDKSDTLSFSTMNANKKEINGLLLNSTLGAFYTGRYTPEMQASKLVQYPQSFELGGDRDERGCIDSAGYVWCEVQQNCVRLFERGIRMEAVGGSTASAFIVFSPDSTCLELFLSDEQPNEILERRGLPSGGYVWSVEDDDAKDIRFIDELWTISQRDKVIYHEKKTKAGE